MPKRRLVSWSREPCRAGWCAPHVRKACLPSGCWRCTLPRRTTHFFKRKPLAATKCFNASCQDAPRCSSQLPSARNTCIAGTSMRTGARLPLRVWSSMPAPGAQANLQANARDVQARSGAHAPGKSHCPPNPQLQAGASSDYDTRSISKRTQYFRRSRHGFATSGGSRRFATAGTGLVAFCARAIGCYRSTG